MKVTGCNFNHRMCFQRALTSREEKDFKSVCEKSMEALGVSDGMRMFKVFQTALPVSENHNMGIGKLNSDSAMRYLEFMALYTGSNAIKIYPAGQFPTRLRFKNYYCPYERTSSVIGEDIINFYKLTQDTYGKILKTSDLEQENIYGAKKVYYENELDKSFAGADYKLIKKAYHNMVISDNPQAKKLLDEFRAFKNSYKTDILDRLAIVPYILENDRDLFRDIETTQEKQDRFREYKNKHYKEIEIYKFGKFLATKSLQDAKKELNDNGLELFGDCPLGFNEDEVIAFPDAFYPENITPGWGFRAINFEEIPKEGTQANKLFREKLEWHFKNFDGIRFDVGWQYIQPKLYECDEKGNIKKEKKLDIGDSILRFIEKTAKKVKGEDYDTRKLLYECDAGFQDFQMFEWGENGPKPKAIMENRTPIITSVYENINGYGWGNPQFYNKTGIKNYIIGTNNHDSTPLRMLAEDEHDERMKNEPPLDYVRKMNREALNKSLGLSFDWLSNPVNFVKAKFAELFQAKNHFVFFNDVIGNTNRQDDGTIDCDNYRYKISSDYEREYHRALQEGHGFNLPESLAIAMKAESMDKTMPNLYKKVKKYGEILRQIGAETKFEAENG